MMVERLDVDGALLKAEALLEEDKHLSVSAKGLP
jgi:hypothetical protein